MGYTTCLGMCGNGAGTGTVKLHHRRVGILLVFLRGLVVSVVAAVGTTTHMLAGVPIGFKSILTTASTIWACAWLVALEILVMGIMGIMGNW